VAGQEAVGGLVIDKRVVSQPLHGAPRGAGIAKGVPNRQQVRMLLVELVFEPRKAPLPWMARASLRPARSSVIASAKSAMSWYHIQDGEREIIASVATRALTEDSVEMEFLTDDPVARAVTYQRVRSDAGAPRCGRYCTAAGRVSWT
jgi:hypothetical protein